MMPPDDKKPEKDRLRREFLRRRAESDPTWRAEASQSITDRALALPEVRGASAVCAFMSRGDEVDTSAIVRSLMESKGALIVPRTLERGLLELRRADKYPEGFARGRFGILEPQPHTFTEIIAVESLEVVFVPGAAFDRRGHRIGYGGGYYDRLLAQCPKAFKVGLAYSFQIVDALPAEPHDVALDLVLTEKEAVMGEAHAGVRVG